MCTDISNSIYTEWNATDIQIGSIPNFNSTEKLYL